MSLKILCLYIHILGGAISNRSQTCFVDLILVECPHLYKNLNDLTELTSGKMWKVNRKLYMESEPIHHFCTVIYDVWMLGLGVQIHFNKKTIFELALGKIASVPPGIFSGPWKSGNPGYVTANSLRSKYGSWCINLVDLKPNLKKFFVLRVVVTMDCKITFYYPCCHQLMFGLFSFSVMWDLFTTPKVKMLRKSLDTYIKKFRTNKWNPFCIWPNIEI
jgi:hypothetical protein